MVGRDALKVVLHFLEDARTNRFGRGNLILSPINCRVLFLFTLSSGTVAVLIICTWQPSIVNTRSRSSVRRKHVSHRRLTIALPHPQILIFSRLYTNPLPECMGIALGDERPSRRTSAQLRRLALCHDTPCTYCDSQCDSGNEPTDRSS